MRRRNGIGDLPAHQNRRDAGADLHHRQRHDEGRDADAGDAEGGEEAERAAGREAPERSRSRRASAGWRCSRNPAAAVKNVSTIAVALAIAPTLRSISAVRMTKVRPTAMIAVTETCWRMFSRLPSEAKVGLAMLKKATRHDQRDERRDVAQLIAQEIARGERRGRSRASALWHVHLDDPIVRRRRAGDPC